MKINRTVLDVKRHLEENGISPETLAKEIGISNMTIRRLLEKGDKEILPEKYSMQFERVLFGKSAFNNASVFDDLISSGKKHKSASELKKKLSEKMNETKLDELFLNNIKMLSKQAFSKKELKYSALAMGALIYFINPMDLVPDFLGPMGLVDDFGILAMACTYISKETRKSK